MRGTGDLLCMASRTVESGDDNESVKLLPCGWLVTRLSVTRPSAAPAVDSTRRDEPPPPPHHCEYQECIELWLHHIQVKQEVTNGHDQLLRPASLYIYHLVLGDGRTRCDVKSEPDGASLLSP